MFVCLSEAELTLYPEDGPPEQSHARPLGVEYTEVGSGITHRLKNTGQTEHWEILVELKGGSRSARPREPQTNDEARAR